MSPATVTCARCKGTGEVVARSRRVGGGCVNDDWDTCPQCHGNGYVKTPEAPQLALSEQQALEILEGFARRGDWQALLAKLEARNTLLVVVSGHLVEVTEAHGVRGVSVTPIQVLP